MWFLLSRDYHFLVTRTNILYNSVGILINLNWTRPKCDKISSSHKLLPFSSRILDNIKQDPRTLYHIKDLPSLLILFGFRFVSNNFIHLKFFRDHIIVTYTIVIAVHEPIAASDIFPPLFDVYILFSILSTITARLVPIIAFAQYLSQVLFFSLILVGKIVRKQRKTCFGSEKCSLCYLIKLNLQSIWFYSADKLI